MTTSSYHPPGGRWRSHPTKLGLSSTPTKLNHAKFVCKFGRNSKCIQSTCWILHLPPPNLIPTSCPTPLIAIISIFMAVFCYCGFRRNAVQLSSRGEPIGGPGCLPFPTCSYRHLESRALLPTADINSWSCESSPQKCFVPTG